MRFFLESDTLMQVDLLIVGQGLCGSWLSHAALKAGKRVCVIDTIQPHTPSRISAGIINPITGRRHVEVWLAEEILSHATTAYGAMEKLLNRKLIRKSSLIDFFPSEQMRNSFRDRIEQRGKYVGWGDASQTIKLPFNQPFGSGSIEPVYLIDLPAFLEGCRQHLETLSALRAERFESALMEVRPDGIHYKDIQAERIVFCDGSSDLSKQFFPHLPYAPNKGEVLILDVPDLPTEHLYKQGLMLAPLSDGSWWCGSSYQWSFDHPHPTAEFREKTEAALKQWLQIPFRVVDHLAGVRPATLERRPFVGFNPSNTRIGILNGMGTKGCSLAPYFADQLMQHWMLGESIHPEAWVGRFPFST